MKIKERNYDTKFGERNFFLFNSPFACWKTTIEWKGQLWQYKLRSLSSQIDSKARLEPACLPPWILYILKFSPKLTEGKIINSYYFEIVITITKAKKKTMCHTTPRFFIFVIFDLFWERKKKLIFQTDKWNSISLDKDDKLYYIYIWKVHKRMWM
jgi:hypothetical protein